MTQEAWRTFRAEDPDSVPPPPLPKPGPNALRIIQGIEGMQDARRRNLERDFDYLETWQMTEKNYLVVNFKSLGRYEVDMEALSCTCPDSFHTYTDESVPLVCKHLLFVALSIRSQNEE